ncbi:MAG: dihydrolipoamide succinyltransferase, partial [Desulfatitalea sp.]|nr:dihydrolipoamide succinyltransferase [Desulfatitalea sp.]
MATLEVKIPSVGESVQEAVLGEWFKQNGDMVEKDEALFVIETDKVTLEVTAEAAGILTILVQAGETVAVGTVVARIEIGAGKAAEAPAKAAVAPEPPKAAAAVKAPAPEVPKKVAPPEATAAAPAPSPAAIAAVATGLLSPAVRRLVAEKQLDL